MKVLIKKFSLVRDGITYNAGSVVDLPDEEALKLSREAAKEFALLEEAADLNIAAPALASAGEAEAAKGGIALEKMTIEQLKNYALENGIDIGKTSKKTDIIGLILAAEAGEDGLPAVDAGALVK